MTWGFERGRIYNRRTDIHAQFSGQRQGGIITPSEFPLVIIITGEAGLAHGYSDRWRPDGVFEYFGEGLQGPMQWRAGNRAIRDHLADGEDLLLFTKTKGGLRYEGEMVCAGYHFEQAPDSQGLVREAIVFELRDLEGVVDTVEKSDEPIANGLSELRHRAYAAAENHGSEKSGVRTVYQRSKDVRDYVLYRTGENCEGCGRPAEFRRPNGAPYFEPHHTRRLSDGGPDHPKHVIGLCASCHRRVHFGADGNEFNETLISVLRDIEA